MELNDYKIIQVIDLELDDESSKRIYLPKTIKKNDIESISPLVTRDGKFYKNLSILETYSNKQYVVVGNYNHLNELNNIKTIGYKK